jgi:hypothetical protein
MLSGEEVPAPPDLFREYGTVLHDFARPVPAEELRARTADEAPSVRP